MSALTPKADIQGLAENYIFVSGRMSAFGGKADLNHDPVECPLLAKSGHSNNPTATAQARSAPEIWLKNQCGGARYEALDDIS